MKPSALPITMLYLAAYIMLIGLPVRAQVCPEAAARHPCDCDTLEERGVQTLEIDCEGMRLNRMPDFSIFRDLPIQFLSLARNNIRTIPAQFMDGLLFSSAFPRQDPNIDLSNNPISSLSDDAFSGVRADTLGLRMENSSLRNIPEVALSKMENWTFLFLDDNRINSVKENDFSTLSKVRHIQLSDNPIMSVHDGAFRSLQDTLKNVHLSNTRLSSLPVGALAPLRKLSILAMDNCRLYEIDDDTFSDFASTQQITIKLQENEIEQFSSTAFRGAHFHLKTLQLENNLISHVDFLYDYCNEVFDNRPSVRLDGNPLNCDCNIFEVIESGRMQLEGTCGTGTSYADMDLTDEFADVAGVDCGIGVLDTSCPKGAATTHSLEVGIMILTAVFAVSAGL